MTQLTAFLEIFLSRYQAGCRTTIAPQPAHFMLYNYRVEIQIYLFIEMRNSSLLRVPFIFSSRNSIASKALCWFK